MPHQVTFYDMQGWGVSIITQIIYGPLLLKILNKINFMTLGPFCSSYEIQNKHDKHIFLRENYMLNNAV